MCAPAASAAAPSAAAEPAPLSGASAAVLESFRRRAGPEVASAAEAGPGGISTTVLGRSIVAAAEVEMDAAFGEGSEGAARTEVEAAVGREKVETLAIVSELEETLKEVRKLRAEKADILAVGFQTTGSENQEFAALIVCATAGIFAVSLHFSFFAIWAIAYLLYKRATRQIRTQRAASDDLGEIVERLRVHEDIEEQLRSRLRAHAAAWAAGLAPPPPPAVQAASAAPA